MRKSLQNFSFAITLMCILSFGFMMPVAQAQIATPSGKAPASNKNMALPAPPAPLDWLTLTPPQRQALQPLATSWPHLTEVHKKKWIVLSANFDTLTPEAKERLHARMAQWAALTPTQRALARLNYTQTQRVTVEDKAERWEVYQSLTAEQKQALAASAPKLPLAPRVKVPKASKTSPSAPAH